MSGPTRATPVAQPFVADRLWPGNVIWVDAGTPMGHEQGLGRPWVVVSANRFHQREQACVIAVPLTRTQNVRLGFPEAHIEIEADEINTTDRRFSPEVCVALTEHIRSVSLDRCAGRVGTITARALSRIRTALGFLLDL